MAIKKQPEWTTSFIKREENIVVHQLAKLALTLQREHFWMEEGPFPFFMILLWETNLVIWLINAMILVLLLKKIPFPPMLSSYIRKYWVPILFHVARSCAIFRVSLARGVLHINHLFYFKWYRNLLRGKFSLNGENCWG